MKELLYMWVESVNNRANLHRQGIQFSNDYIVNLKRNDNFDIIEFINIFEKDNLYRNFYGENIIDISALVGVNGVGKTTILDILGSPRDMKKKYLYEWRFFLLYKMDEKYIIEGNGLDIVENFILNIPEITSDEFSLICEYKADLMKFVCVGLCHASGEMEKSIKYFYFQDKPTDKHLKNEYEFDTDYNICFERMDMKPNAANIYKTCNYIRNDKEFNSHINMQRLSFRIDSKTDMIIKSVANYRKESIREVFVIKVLLSIIYRMDTGKTVVESLPIDLPQNIFYYNPVEYEKYKLLLVEAIDAYKSWGWDKDKVVTADLIDLLEQIPDEFFPEWEENNRIALNYVNLSFSIRNDYSEALYNLLLRYSEYLSFSYYGISAGEKEILDVFSGVFSHVNIFEEDNRVDERTNIILMDEPDKGLHPEMSRRLISWLVKVFNNIKDTRNKYQFIISTHSPFLVSDIPIPYIHCLEYRKKDKFWITEINNASFGLLNSIPDLMKKTFFMESPFGEYGNQYFISLVKEINELQTISDTEKLRLIKQKISIVNDQVLYKYLTKTLEKKIEELGTVDEQIMYYEEKIKELRGMGAW